MPALQRLLVLLVNLPPDQTGRIRENEREAILATADQLGIRGGKTPLPKAPVNQAAGVRAEADSVYGPGYGADKAVDGSLESRWAAKDAVAALTLVPERPFEFDRIAIHEYAELKDLGDGFSKQRAFRVRAFAVDALRENEWTKVYEGAAIGAAKVIRLDRKVKADRLRLRITEASEPASLYLITVSDSATRTPR